jgi:hypothetical protein
MTLYDESGGAETVAAGASTTELEIKTAGNAEHVTVFVDDDTGGAPSDYTLHVERYSPALDEWMDYDNVETTGSTGPTAVTDPAIPSKMRYSLTNDSAASATFRIRLVSY